MLGFYVRLSGSDMILVCCLAVLFSILVPWFANSWMLMGFFLMCWCVVWVPIESVTGMVKVSLIIR